jgi:Uma2 family endonuclease
MNENYEEIVEGETLMRSCPGARHEAICTRLHQLVAESVTHAKELKLLPVRSVIQLSPGTMIRPDLTLISSWTGKLFLAVEIIHAGDHRTDTVIKKSIYEDHRVPRLWMVDPRYDNVEVYQSGEYGLTLHEILAGREVLTETLLPAFRIVVAELFSEESAVTG